MLILRGNDLLRVSLKQECSIGALLNLSKLYFKKKKKLKIFLVLLKYTLFSLIYTPYTYKNI